MRMGMSAVDRRVVAPLQSLHRLLSRPSAAAWIKASIVSLALLIAYPLGFIRSFGSHMGTSPDMFWHIHLGEEMLRTGRIPHIAIDAFTPTAPYVPQEVGYQLLAGFTYEHFGWPGMFAVYVLALGALIWGLYGLVAVARREVGWTGFPVATHLLIAVVVVVIAQLFFKLRPQLISTPLVLWFFIWLRQFDAKPGPRRLAPLLGAALVVANIHAGVWPLLVVLFGISLAAAAWEKTLRAWHVCGFLLLLATGVCNAGGWHSITYFFTVTGGTDYQWISEWQPIDFLRAKALLAIYLLYLFSLVVGRNRTPFRLLFGLAIAALGITGIRFFLYFLLFALYFVQLPAWPDQGKAGRLVPYAAASALLLTLVAGLGTRFTVPPKAYPVQEMGYILGHVPTGSQPKVLAPYGESGYIIFRGSRILADGRFDPFVSDVTRAGADHLTALERSIYTFQGYTSVLQEEMGIDRPNYVIIPQPAADQPMREHLLAAATDLFGPPVFRGAFGDVFAPQSQH